MNTGRWTCVYVRGARRSPPGEAALPSPREHNSPLALLAESMMRFSPYVSLIPGDQEFDPEGQGIWLETGRSAHLFGGEGALMEQIWGLCTQLGFSLGLATADQHETARILAICSYEAGVLFQSPRGRDREILSPYPIRCLAPSQTTQKFLRDLGIETLGELGQLNADTLGRRLGSEGSHIVQMAQAKPQPPPPQHIPESTPEFSWELDQPVLPDEALVFILKRLLSDLSLRLEGREQGTTQFQLQLLWDTGAMHTERFLLPRPMQSDAALLSVVRLRLADQLPRSIKQEDDEERRIEKVTIRIQQLSLMPERQRDLFQRKEQYTEALTSLVGRLHLILGARRVFGVQSCSSHLPEASWEPVDFIRSYTRAEEHLPEPEMWGQELPTFVLPTALAVRGALIPGARLSWSGGHGHLRQSWGPERIRGAWWSRPFARDYFIAEFETGARVWLYRDLYTLRLYLHGVYD